MLLPILSAALAAYSWSQQPALTNESLDRLVSLPEEEVSSSTGEYRRLQGFEDSDHLAPVLLPSESRFRVLQSKEQVRDALALDPVLSRLNASLSKAIASELGRSASGAALLEIFGEKLPPILFTESSVMVGTYKPALDAVAVSWKDVQQLFPEARDMDCGGLQRFLAESPERTTRLAGQFGPIFMHELVHARQQRLFQLQLPRPPVEMEEEAYFDETRFMLDRLEAGADLLSSGERLHATYGQALSAFAPSLERFLKAIRTNYVGTSRAVPLRSALAQQRRALEGAAEGPARDEARTRLIRLERAEDYYDRLRVQMEKDWAGLSNRASTALAKARARPN